eukprot:scaffold43000_cov18-Tisochrysis_lutea.AAC.1
MQRDKATFSVNLEHHFAPLLYAKILLWELYAVTCPQPVSPSTSGMTEKDCKEQLKALLPILHAYVVFSPGDSISRISLHAAWLYTHVTMHIFKDKKLSAEQAEAIQEIRSTLQSVRSTLITEPTVDKILYLKPEKEMVDPNPSPDDKTFEGLVACCTFDDKKIVEKLLRMAVQVCRGWRKGGQRRLTMRNCLRGEKFGLCSVSSSSSTCTSIPPLSVKSTCCICGAG